jgi:hypothetical protein
LETRAEVLEAAVFPRMLQMEPRIIRRIVSVPMVIVDMRPGIYPSITHSFALPLWSGFVARWRRRRDATAIPSVLATPLRNSCD